MLLNTMTLFIFAHTMSMYVRFSGLFPYQIIHSLLISMTFLFLSKFIITMINPVLKSGCIYVISSIWGAFGLHFWCYYATLKTTKKLHFSMWYHSKTRIGSPPPLLCNRTLCYYDIWVVRVRVLRLHWASENFVKRSINTIYFS